MRWFMILLMTAGVAQAKGQKAGDFDYYVMALSWSPNWCAIEGDARESDQCDPRHDHGWILHGLWPQFETGWPSNCRTSQRNPSRSDTGAMADIMGTGGLAWHQWQKHGRCSGLSAADYFALSRKAYNSVTRPPVLRQLPKSVQIAPGVIEEVWLKHNPDLTANGLTVTCKARHIQEVRICLTPDLTPRTCGRDVIRDCTAETATFDPVR
ncbi:MAG: ribonuclease T2 [Pseudomonadota bacterium]